MALGSATVLLGAISFSGYFLKVPVFAQVETWALPRSNGTPTYTTNPAPHSPRSREDGKGSLRAGSSTERKHPSTQQDPQVVRAALSRTPSEVTAVVLAGGEQRGSAVALRSAVGGTWLVTNQHVVDGESDVCVRTADGRLWRGQPVMPRLVDRLDITFLWLPGAIGLPTATIAPPTNKAQSTWGFSIVRAAGYPVDEQQKTQPPAFRELRGLLLPLLPQPLEGGMQLATTVPVRKGMSGGGLFDEQGILLGLNTTHADPLWPAPLREEGGKPIPIELNRKLELVALAIPITRLVPLLERVHPPSRPISDEQKRATGESIDSTPAMTNDRDRSNLSAVCNGRAW